MSLRTTLLAAAVALPALAAAPAAHAAPERDTLVRHRIASTGPLAGTGLTATSRASVVVPAAWRRRSGSSRTTLRLLVTRGPACHHDVVVTQRLVVGAASATARSRAADALPASDRYVLDDGDRRSMSWRVVRRPGTRDDPRVRLAAVRVSPAFAEPGALAEDQRLWLEVRATATSRRGDECHSGTYREVVGPALGDAMATARVSGRAYRPR